MISEREILLNQIVALVPRQADFLFFGEQHGCPNPFQKVGAALMPVLKEFGVTHLAVELSVRLIGPHLEKFNETGSYKDLLTLLKKTYSSNMCGKADDGSEIAPEDTDYFQLLLAAHAAEIKLVPVDVFVMRVGTRPREPFIVEHLIALKNQSQQSPVAYWGGLLHCHNRPFFQIPRSAAEIVHAAGYKTFSLAGVNSCDAETFPQLIHEAQFLNEPKLISRAAFAKLGRDPALSKEFDLRDFEITEDGAPAMKERIEIECSAFDALILFPQRSNKIQ